MHSETKLCLSLPPRGWGCNSQVQHLPTLKCENPLRAFLDAGFQRSAAIMPVLLCVLACIYQADKTLKQGCHGNKDNPEIELKMTNMSYFSQCDLPQSQTIADPCLF